MSERVNKLKEKVRGPPKICIERAYWVTESYKETEGQPPIIRRALALKKVLENIPVIIEDEELIVGKTTSKTGRGIALAPEVCTEVIIKDILESDVIMVGGTSVIPLTDEEKKKLREICAYWKGKTLYDVWRCVIPLELLDPEDLQTLGYNQILGPRSGFFIAHFCPDYEKVLRVGLNGIKNAVKEKMENLDLSKIEDFEKWLFYKSAIIALDAVITFANRYAELAKKKAEAELDPKRKDELEKIAEICSWVPANPARNFHEAIQSIWFIYVAMWMEAMGPAICLGRLDQILYPFYKKDLEEGRMTREEAKELIELLYIKCNEVSLFQPRILGVFDTGAGALPNITIGGITKDNRCAVNELSYLFLEAEDEVLLAFEEIIVRVHNSTPEAFLMKAVQTAKLGRGKLKFCGDNRSIEMLLSLGKSIEEARDYYLSGCFMLSVPGKSLEIAPAYINMAYFLELALNNGISRMTGKRVGIETGNPRKFKSYDEVLNAFKKQFEDFLRRFLPFVNIYVWIYAKYAPYPFTSCLFDGPIEKGVDLLNGGTLHYTQALWLVGVVNVADALAAIKKLVFEERRLTMDRLIDALDNNFENYEDVLYLINRCPKFGNDDDYVDSILNEVITIAHEAVSKFEGYRGAKFTLAGGSVTMNMAAGKFTGALPDGRRAGEPLAEGGLSPHQGRNITGPLSTFRSIAKLDLTKLANGTAVNMKFNPDAVKDEIKMKKFISLLRTYFESGGQHIQFNIVSSDMLKDAQKYPEKYKDLLVRVATYTAYFVELSQETQNDIIARTEFREII